MKLLQAIAGAPHGGAEGFFTRLAPALQKTDIDQRVIIRTDADRKAQLQSGGVDPLELRFGGRLDIFTPRALRREINKFKPDVVMTWMNRATIMCQKKPSDTFVHVARLGGYYDLKYYQHCDHLIGNTEHIVEYLIENGWPADKAHYVPNFVVPKMADPISRKEFSTPERVPLILSYGRLHENKAFDVLIEALERVPDAYLWLAGTGPLHDELEALAVKHGVRPRIRFLGWRTDTAALMATADIFVCPSRHEPLGNVVIEAWAQDIPVVATASQGPAKLIADRASGLLVPVDDIRELAGAINEALRDPELCDHIAAGGMQSFESQFTEQIIIDKYLEFFSKVLK